MPLANIESNLFTRHPKNLNHVKKDINDILSVIIILRTHVHGGETGLYDGENVNDIGKIAHVLKNSHGRCVVGPFDKVLNEIYIWTGHRYVIYFTLHKSIFIHFVHHCTRLFEKYNIRR